MQTLNELEKLFETFPKHNNLHIIYVNVTNPTDNPELILDGVLLYIEFYPNEEYFEDRHLIELHFYENGLAHFEISPINDPDYFPELWEFTGTWKQSIAKLVDLVKIGWHNLDFKNLSIY